MTIKDMKNKRKSFNNITKRYLFLIHKEINIKELLNVLY